jgi:PDZ domain-containing protein
VALEPRTVLLLASGFIAVVLAAAMALLPVPYAVLSPGPVVNTLGKHNDVKLISVSGHATYPAKGELDLTTVSVRGGPGDPMNLVSAIRAWLEPASAVVPRDSVFPPGQTQEQQDQENAAEMTGSQEAATAAAMGALKVPFTTRITIAGFTRGAPAAKSLKAGDVVVAVNGAKVADLDGLRDQLQRVKAGQPVTVRVQRGGKDSEATVVTQADQGRTVLGVTVNLAYVFPFTVKIEIDDIGGPSAGMMFALGIIDTLTPGDLTGGRRIAGTGEIAVDGRVGPIGGIRQKLRGARGAGAEWFLAPADNCDEVREHVPGGLRDVRVATLTEAEAAVKSIAAGRGGTLPHC